MSIEKKADIASPMHSMGCQALSGQTRLDKDRLETTELYALGPVWEQGEATSY